MLANRLLALGWSICALAYVYLSTKPKWKWKRGGDHDTAATGLEQGSSPSEAMEETKSKSKEEGIKAKSIATNGGKEGVTVVVQRCNQAKLLVDNGNSWISIGRGLVVYVSMDKATTEESLDRVAKALISLPLVTLGKWGDGSKPISVLDSLTDWYNDKTETKDEDGRVSMMVVPQASLTAKFKGKNIKYHNQMDKTKGLEMYRKLILKIEDAVLDGMVQHMFKKHIVMPKHILSSMDGEPLFLRDDYKSFDKRGCPTSPLTKQEYKQVNRVFQAIQEHREKVLKPRALAHWSRDGINTNEDQNEYFAPLRIAAGTWGNLQALRLISDCGPSTHLLQI